MINKIKTRKCPICKKQLPRTQEYWHRHVGYTDNLSGYCKKCHRKKYKYSNLTRDRIQNQKRMANEYSRGISEEDFVLLMKEVDSKCEICNRKFLNNGRLKACLDHDHITGKIRGLLCNNCNSGLGFFGDSQERLIKAKEYLKHKS